MSDDTGRWGKGKFLSALRFILFLIALDAFFISIHLLSAFKGLSSQWGQNLAVELAHNPFLGLMVGVLVTSVAQSSSATTSMVVALAAGGMFGSDMGDAVRITVPIIMGANIGTSVTNILVSIGHIGQPAEFRRAFAAAMVHDFFNVLSVCVFLPLQIATDFLGKLATFAGSMFEAGGGIKAASPLKMLIKPQVHIIEGFFDHHIVCKTVLAFGIAYGALSLFRLMVKAIVTGRHPNRTTLALAATAAAIYALLEKFGHILASKQVALLILAGFLLFGALAAIVGQSRRLVQSRFEILFHRYIFRSKWASIITGALLTAIVQSSSVTTSIVVPLAGAGILATSQIYFYTLGANLGTTVTAILAALSTANPTAVAVSMAHLLFNIMGISVFFPLSKVPITLAEKFAEASMKRRWLPFAFVLTLFFALPLSLIMIFK